jgi:hypothetical protein
LHHDNHDPCQGQAAAQFAKLIAPYLLTFGALLRANGLAPKSVVGAAMRKLAHLIFGIVRSGMPFNAQMAMPELDLQDGI